MIHLKWRKMYFSKSEIVLWFCSVSVIAASFFIFDRENPVTLAASLTGVTSLVFYAKGNPFGPFLMVLFSLLYGMISFSFDYYGEMITYLGMTLPMSVISLISWLKNPYQGAKAEVKINRITRNEVLFMWLLTVVVTIVFYWILDYFHTANLFPSSLSVTTSFLAAYLTFRRSPYYAVAYAVNDLILIVLWILASIQNIQYCSVVVCFVTFLVNDVYGFLSWKAMEKRQTGSL